MIFIDMRLSKRKIQKLNIILGEIHKDNFDFDSLHGFLTAIYCAPQIIMPSVWIQHIINPGEDEIVPLIFKETDKLLKEAMELYNNIGSDVLQGQYLPYMNGYEFKSRHENPPLMWCKGFLKGAALWGMDFNKKKNKKIFYIIMPIVIHINPEEWINHLKEDGKMSDEEFLDNIYSDIPDCVYILRDLFIIHNENEDNEIPFTNKVGRNEPCPCGSGKKYKYCCGR